MELKEEEKTYELGLVIGTKREREYWQNKIKAKIEEIQSTIQVYGGFTAGKMVEYYRKLGKIEALKNLLSEEK